jgi:FkbH-like protein
MTETAQQGSQRGAIRTLAAEGQFDRAWELAAAELLEGEDPAAWSTARNVLRAGERADWRPRTRRAARVAVLCTYESVEFSEHLALACMAFGLQVETHVAPYGQVEQEVLGAGSALAAFQPTHVLLAPATADLGFEELSGDPEAVVAAAAERWVALWRAIRADLGARVIQHGFVVPDESPLGHLSMRVPAAAVSMTRALNARLAHEAGAEVLLVDCERLAAGIGKHRWEDPRLWYHARLPFSHAAQPLLARATAGVLAGDLGLAARCLVLDLDNTLWGGVVGEDGEDGIRIGQGPDGEAFAAFQDHVAALRRRGIVLAVASKNDLQAARGPFERRAEMRLKIEDFAAFVADWRRKPEQIAEIAQTLGLGLDALVFVDDNPAECAEVRAALSEVTTICLDMPPAERVRRLAASPRFELSSLSAEDETRGRSYAARADAQRLRETASSLEDFWRSLEMHAQVRAVEPGTLERAAQLVQKTNQFNLTLRRHPREEVERFVGEPRAICRTLALEDRFADHGLIGLAIVLPSDSPEVAEIDTLLLSCRVIGRTAEAHLLGQVSEAAIALGYRRLRGLYVPGPRNELVADLYPKLSFEPAGERAWEYDLMALGPIRSEFITERP